MNMKITQKIQQTFLLLLSLSFIGACSTIKKEELGKIKKAAIVGFTLDQEDSSANKKVMDKISSSSYSKQVYETLAQETEKKLGWDLLSVQQFKNNSKVKVLFGKKDKLMDQLFSSNTPFVGQRRLEMPGVPQAYFTETLSQEDLSQLASSLGVDALIIVTVNARKSLNHAMMMAQSEGKFQTDLIDVHLSYKVFDGINGSKIAGLQYQSGPMNADEKSYKGITGKTHIKSFKAYESVLSRVLGSLK